MATMNDYDALKKQMPNVVKKLKEKTDASKPFFTKRDAVRVWIWNQQNMEIPELSQSDKNSLFYDPKYEIHSWNFEVGWKPNIWVCKR